MGYNNDRQHFTFEGGKLKHITIAATAGNVTTNLTPNTGKRWKLLNALITVVCDITVATRAIVIYITDGTNIARGIAVSPNVVASGTGTLQVQEIMQTALAATGVYPTTAVGLAVLEDADQLRILINAGVAGDSYSGYVWVMEIPY